VASVREEPLEHDYKELTIPGRDGKHVMDPNAMHIWPRGGFMLIALPNLDGTFTATLFLARSGNNSFEQLRSAEDVDGFFVREFPSARALIPDLLREWFEHPQGSLGTVYTRGWHLNGDVLLLGDAAHAIVPFHGQGMNCGFEDCSILNGLITKHHDEWTAILSEFQQLRKPDTDAIAELALNNFIEMRDKVADPRFLLQKKIEARLNENFPGKWIPSYSQVTFSPHIRYSEALRNSQRQDEVMQGVMQLPNIEEIWNDDVLHQKIIEQLVSKEMN